MPNVTLKGLPPGNAELHYAAKVEPFRNGNTLTKPAALSTVAVAAGEATFNLTDDLEYVVIGSDGRGRNVLSASTKGWPS
jgi:hypothetical protein